jgi:hypothetical protein
MPFDIDQKYYVKNEWVTYKRSFPCYHGMLHVFDTMVVLEPSRFTGWYGLKCYIEDCFNSPRIYPTIYTHCARNAVMARILERVLDPAAAKLWAIYF